MTTPSYSAKCWAPRYNHLVLRFFSRRRRTCFPLAKKVEVSVSKLVRFFGCSENPAFLNRPRIGLCRRLTTRRMVPLPSRPVISFRAGRAPRPTCRAARRLRPRLPDRDARHTVEVVVVRGQVSDSMTLHQCHDQRVVGQQAVITGDVRSMQYVCRVDRQTFDRRREQRFG